MKYGPIIRKEQNFRIDTEICYRAQNVIAQNLAQYMILMKTLPDDRKNWNGSWGKSKRSIMKTLTTNENIELGESMDAFRNSIDISSVKKVILSRKQENMIKKTNDYKMFILLHNSLIFNKSSLYVNSFLKKGSSLLEEHFLKPLVNAGYLLAIPNGLICSKSKSTIYIKMIPSNDDDLKDKLIKLFENINDARLNYNTYMASCKSVWLDTKGVVSQEVIETLQQERYQCLNIDFTSIFQHNRNENEGQTSSKMFNFNL
jgi:hypothetical protein